MAVNLMNRIPVHLEVVDSVPQYIGFVGAQRLSPFVEHCLHSVGASFVVAIARITVNVNEQPLPVTITGPHSERPSSAGRTK